MDINQIIANNLNKSDKEESFKPKIGGKDYLLGAEYMKRFGDVFYAEPRINFGITPQLTQNISPEIALGLKDIGELVVKYRDSPEKLAIMLKLSFMFK